MSTDVLQNLDANIIAPRIVQGAYPKAYEKGGLSKLGYKYLVLAAEELQPKGYFGDVKVIYMPYDDSYKPLSPSQWLRIKAIASSLAEAVKKGDQVLITCAMGWNRSGLITAMTLAHLHPTATGEQIVELIQRRRAGALSNDAFVEKFVQWTAAKAQQRPKT